MKLQALVFILGFLALQAMCRTLPHHASMHEKHEQWMTKYEKVYKDSSEKEMRFKIFKQNVEWIEAFNSNNAGKNHAYKVGINQFADLTNEEFKASKNRFKGHMCSSLTKTETFKYENLNAVPPSLDWRKKGAVTPIKDQEFCGEFEINSGFIIINVVF